MQRNYFVPVEGQIYKNRNGSAYRCTGNETYPDAVKEKTAVSLGKHWASMVRLTDGWSIRVHGVHQYEDGTIEWNFSSGGSFQSDALPRCQKDCKSSGTDLCTYFDFLDCLRDSGTVNMFGAVPCLRKEFPELDRNRARRILQAWMDSYSS